MARGWGLLTGLLGCGGASPVPEASQIAAAPAGSVADADGAVARCPGTMRSFVLTGEVPTVSMGAMERTRIEGRIDGEVLAIRYEWTGLERASHGEPELATLHWAGELTPADTRKWRQVLDGRLVSAVEGANGWRFDLAHGSCHRVGESAVPARLAGLVDDLRGRASQDVAPSVDLVVQMSGRVPGSVSLLCPGGRPSVDLPVRGNSVSVALRDSDGCSLRFGAGREMVHGPLGQGGTLDCRLSDFAVVCSLR